MVLYIEAIKCKMLGEFAIRVDMVPREAAFCKAGSGARVFSCVKA